MMNVIGSLIMIFSATFCQGQQFTDLYGDYPGQTPPGDVPVIFAPGIVSINGRYEYGLSISPDGKYIFFSRYNEPEEKCNIYWVSSSVIDSLKKNISNW